MKRLVLILFLLLGCIGFTHAQDVSYKKSFTKKNSVQLDLGGHGFLYSLNFERIIFNSDRFKTGLQAGVSYYPVSTGVRNFWFPMTLNEIISFNQHHVEIGGGVVFTYEKIMSSEQYHIPSRWEWFKFYAGRIGYRYQKPEGKFIFRAGFTPLMEIEDFYREFHPTGGVSFGYAF